MYLCVCRGVSDSKVQEALNKGCSSLKQLSCQTGLGTKCGVCRKHTHQMIKQFRTLNSGLSCQIS